MAVFFFVRSGKHLIRVWLLILFLAGMGAACSHFHLKTPPKVSAPRITVAYTWPEFPFEYKETSAARVREWTNVLGQARLSTVRAAAPKYRKITLTGSGLPAGVFWITTLGEVTDAAGRCFAGPGLSRAARELGNASDRSFFGEPLTWPEVAPLLPVGGTAKVRDLETGIHFSVRRHRGDSHADVEPLTIEDTKRMKRIFGGEWSWRRRAVVVTVKERNVAGSMNGMPHGWGDIFDNEFPGHFCIHFKDSRVHTTWRPDPGHQLMVIKSSGRLAAELDQAAPDRVVYWVLAAIHYRETATLTHATVGLSRTGLLLLIRPVRHLEILSFRTLRADDATADVEAHLAVYFRTGDPQKPFRKTLQIRLAKVAGKPGWVVKVASLCALFGEITEK